MPRKYYPIPQIEEVKYLNNESELQNIISSLDNLNIQDSERIDCYNFLCKCQEKFSTFSEFLDHAKDSHGVENPDFSEIFARRNNSKWDIKFYWHLSCECGHKFSSSLCNADLKVKKEGIELLKKYRLQCSRCGDYAEFNEEELLDEFLEERVKQKLIYSYYRKEFEQFKIEIESEKRLVGHKQELCEKCQTLGKYCGGDY